MNNVTSNQKKEKKMYISTIVDIKVYILKVRDYNNTVSGILKREAYIYI